MSLKLWLIKGDVLERNSAFAWNVLQHSIHQGKWITMRQQTHDLLGIQHRSGSVGRGKNGQVAQR
jgi:hypothetical protein